MYLEFMNRKRWLYSNVAEQGLIVLWKLYLLLNKSHAIMNISEDLD